MYYMARPLIPRRAQLAMRRKLIEYQKGEFAESWPILKSAAKPPMGWRGWPEGKQFAVVLTHDVELKRGHVYPNQIYSYDIFADHISLGAGNTGCNRS